MPQKQILVVEDNPINRATLCGILSGQYQILEAEHGAQALEILHQWGDDVALVLLDIIMPVMDGYTFLSLLKADPALASIPVIVTTQRDGESDEVLALSHGAADFVTKPYKPQIILHRVAALISLVENTAMVRQFQHDQLTGIYSQAFFYQRARELMLQYPEREYDIICSDVENFKLINDIFGSAAGDALLCLLADLYLELVGEYGICSHLSADRFACLLERPQAYTDEMFIQTGRRVNEQANTKNVVMKWGIYQVEDRTVSVEQMCDRALLAACSIKGQYGRYFARYDDELRSKLLREQAITDSMERALAQNQFQVYLQPKYNVKSGRMAGVEALARWIHPTWGCLAPAEFIPLFERNGFITRLDRYVWERACAMMRQWTDRGYPPTSISVNVSRADVYQADLAELLTNLVQQYGLHPSSLHLEITESAYTENPDQIIATMDHLRQLGFIIEMDDFGTGYSSLNMLNQMPLDILKLDMGFIQSETAKPVEQGILHFIMGLARWMNLDVVAEGVETENQLERLRELGCDYVQGYYFARPMPAEEFEGLLRRSRGETRPGPAAEQARTRLLLVADEDKDYCRQVRETFGGKYQVLDFSDGRELLSCIADCEREIAAVVLSLALPDSDGLSALEVLHREKAGWHIPLIATAPPDPRLEERALELGADDFIGKPHTQKSLWQRVVRVVGAASTRAREGALKDAASRDYLTGLLNRRGLDAAVETLREEDMPLAIYLFDLDNLKQINDHMGHGDGDRALRRLGELLRRHTRGTDILARFGGDEFVVIVRRMDSPQSALGKGREICLAYQQSGLTDGLPTACSGGLVLCRDLSQGLERLLAQADQALYTAKMGEKGTCCLWQEPPATEEG